MATDGKHDFVFRNDFPFPRLSADCQRSRTMHFIGMLAAPIPADAVYLVLPTVVSFPICALAVGISLFFVRVDNPSLPRVAASVILLGAAIARMHDVGMQGLSGHFSMIHASSMVVLSVAIAIVAACGGLRAFLSRPNGGPITARQPGQMP